MLVEIPALRALELPPDSRGAAGAFANLGYDLVDALADIVDNAIDAKAAEVNIVFHRRGDRIETVSIADTGQGMAEEVLLSAMRFAGNNARSDRDLGAFGLGLKTASLSQCESLTVISRRDRKVSACRWTKEGMANDWCCEVLAPVPAALVFDESYDNPPPSNAPGTVILWHRLTRLGVAADFEGFISKLLGDLELKLGLIFHRFIAKGTLAITLSARDSGSTFSIPRSVRSYDPFDYGKSGRVGYPKVFNTEVPEIGPLSLKAHIWPAGRSDPNFWLGRRTGTYGQGFYVYRNDRLIVRGGWLGVYKDEADPELSLARASIDLPQTAMRAVTVQKSGLQLTVGLADALLASKCDQQNLTSYLDEARKVYRAKRKKPYSNGDFPIVPGEGIPVAVRRAAEKKLGKDGLVRRIAFEWASMRKAEVFAIDADADRIVLNRKYRKKILGPNRASGVDAPIVKLLLFLLLETEFDRERSSEKLEKWLKHCNGLLLEVIKCL